MAKKMNIVLVTNHLTPYRRKFYDEFFKQCEQLEIQFTVLLMTKCEPKRNWDYENLKVDYSILLNGFHLNFPINNHLNFDVIKQLKRIKPDLVLMAGSYMYYTNWLVMMLKKRIHYPIIYWNEAHFNEKRDYNRIILKIRDVFRRIIFPNFDGYWYSGKMSKEFVQYYSNNDPKLYFVPNLIDHSKYILTNQYSNNKKEQIKNKLDIKKDSFTIIIPARLSQEKGIHTFLTLLSKCDIQKRLTILIPGTGDYKQIIEKNIPEDKLIDVRLLGFQSEKNMLALYSISNLFLLPSLSDPNPLTCIEALWCGLPLLVSTHVGNYPEVIKKGVNGEVFDYSKPEEAKCIIEKVMNANNEWFKHAKKESLLIADKIYNSNKVISRVINKMIMDFE
jgi:glycosyltransferase involved in cell wall biosynthesis